MIGLLKGKVVYKDKNPVVILTGGVGYEVYVGEKLLASIKTDADITLHTHTNVKDDAIELFGFDNRDDLDIFHLLITVSGVGPKTALTVAGKGATAVKNAIVNSDTDFFMTVPRLGKKNAQKIIIELKNKLGSLTELDLTGKSGGETADLIEALIQMGFAKSEIISAIRDEDFGDDQLENRIRKSLKLLGRK